MFCFRRYRTSHLLNLRFLEDEIAKTELELYQAGMSLDVDPECKDDMKSRTATGETDSPQVEDIINQECVFRLRNLIKEYGTELFRMMGKVLLIHLQTLLSSHSIKS